MLASSPERAGDPDSAPTRRRWDEDLTPRQRELWARQRDGCALTADELQELGIGGVDPLEQRMDRWREEQGAAPGGGDVLPVAGAAPTDSEADTGLEGVGNLMEDSDDDEWGVPVAFGAQPAPHKWVMLQPWESRITDAAGGVDGDEAGGYALSDGDWVGSEDEQSLERGPARSEAPRSAEGPPSSTAARSKMEEEEASSDDEGPAAGALPMRAGASWSEQGGTQGGAGAAQGHTANGAPAAAAAASSSAASAAPGSGGGSAGAGAAAAGDDAGGEDGEDEEEGATGEQWHGVEVSRNTLLQEGRWASGRHAPARTALQLDGSDAAMLFTGDAASLRGVAEAAALHVETLQDISEDEAPRLTKEQMDRKKKKENEKRWYSAHARSDGTERPVEEFPDLVNSVAAEKLLFSQGDPPPQQLPRWHRPRVHFKPGDRVTLRFGRATLTPHQEAALRTEVGNAAEAGQGKFRTTRDLSASAGRLAVVEHVEQHPPLLPADGMAGIIRYYTRRAASRGDDEDDAYEGSDEEVLSEFDEFQSEEEEAGEAGDQDDEDGGGGRGRGDGDVRRLGADERCRLLGDVGSDATRRTWITNLAASPLARHRASRRDFVVVVPFRQRARDPRTDRCEYGGTLRRMPATYLAGQQEPRVAAFHPSAPSDGLADFVKSFARYHCARLFSSRTRVPGSALRGMLWTHTDETRLAVLRTMARSGREGWERNGALDYSALMEEARSGFSVEDVCRYEAMLASWQRLLQRGVPVVEAVPPAAATALQARLHRWAGLLEGAARTCEAVQGGQMRAEVAPWAAELDAGALTRDARLARDLKRAAGYVTEQTHAAAWAHTADFLTLRTPRMLLMVDSFANPLGLNLGTCSFVAEPQAKQRIRQRKDDKIAKTEGDLRKYTQEQLVNMLRRRGASQADIDSWHRWKRVRMVKELYPDKFVRYNRQTLADRRVAFDKRVRQLADRHDAFLAGDASVLAKTDAGEYVADSDSSADEGRQRFRPASGAAASSRSGAAEEEEESSSGGEGGGTNGGGPGRSEPSTGAGAAASAAAAGRGGALSSGDESDSDSSSGVEDMDEMADWMEGAWASRGTDAQALAEMRAMNRTEADTSRTVARRVECKALGDGSSNTTVAYSFAQKKVDEARKKAAAGCNPLRGEAVRRAGLSSAPLAISPSLSYPRRLHRPWCAGWRTRRAARPSSARGPCWSSSSATSRDPPVAHARRRAPAAGGGRGSRL